MTRHIGYIHGSKLEPFSPPSFCRSGTTLQEYIYYRKSAARAQANRTCRSKTAADSGVEGCRKMMERLLDVEVTRYGTIIEEVEMVCCMTGFRLRLLVEHLCDGSCRSIELGPG